MIVTLLTLLLVVGSSQSVQEPVHNPNPNYSGTCASIGYSTKCCPPEENCQASDGNCRCSTDCHNEYLDDCCEDVFCHPGSMQYGVYEGLTSFCVTIIKNI